MRNGISGASVPLDLVYAGDVNAATLAISFSPLLTYAIAEVETIEGQLRGEWNAATVVSGDGGHGVMQITPEDWWSTEMRAEWASTNWQVPHDNITFALKWFLTDAEKFWSEYQGQQGIALVRCISAEYNAGRSNALKGHASGDVGLYTFHENGLSYPDHTALNYNALLAKVGA